jgi:segregation and condensation protein B
MNLKSIIESILFAYGDPISLKKLGKAAGAEEEKVEEALEELKRDYQDRGLCLVEKDGEYQLGSNPENAKYIEELVKNEFTEELSRAAVETLAIVAYKGPLPRADIEYVRGVNCSFTLRNLLMRGLVERIDNPRDARSYLYRVSFRFLEHLGLKSVEDLPGFAEFKTQKIELPEVPRPTSVGRDGGQRSSR